MTGLKYHSYAKIPFIILIPRVGQSSRSSALFKPRAFFTRVAVNLTVYMYANSRVGAGKGSSFAYVQSHTQLHLDIRLCAALPTFV